MRESRPTSFPSSLLTSSMAAEMEFTDVDYKKLLRKVDYILLPLMWWCYGIQQTDKTGLGTMNLYGLQADTGMVGNQYSLLTVVFCEWLRDAGACAERHRCGICYLRVPVQLPSPAIQ